MSTVRVIMVCPNCGNSTFIYEDGGFECLACEDVVYPADLSFKVLEAHELSQIGLIELSKKEI